MYRAFKLHPAVHLELLLYHETTIKIRLYRQIYICLYLSSAEHYKEFYTIAWMNSYYNLNNFQKITFSVSFWNSSLEQEELLFTFNVTSWCLWCSSVLRLCRRLFSSLVSSSSSRTASLSFISGFSWEENFTMCELIYNKLKILHERWMHTAPLKSTNTKSPIDIIREWKDICRCYYWQSYVHINLWIYSKKYSPERKFLVS